MDSVELLFLGTGTSAGVPMIGCHCAVCTSSDARDKRMRPSVVMSYGNTRVLVDTTPELRLQAIANGIDRIDAIVYTHAHADHIMGLDDVRRYNTIKGGALDVWADDETYESLLKCFGYAFKGPAKDGMFRPDLMRRKIGGQFEIAGVKWTAVPLIHGGERTLGFRIGRLAYCTDVSEIPEESYELLRDLDVLVLGALHYRPHVKHFSLEQAAEAGARTAAKRVLLTHLSHAIGHEAGNGALPENVRLAYDGMRVTAPIR